MTLTLEQIITQGGPVGFALLFAYLWLQAGKKIETLEGKLEEVKARELAKAEEDSKFYRDLAQKAGANV